MVAPLLVLINGLVYYHLAVHGFVTLDDSVYVTGNEYVKQGLTGASIRWAFTTFHAEFWHPVTWLSYLVDTELFGVNPGGYLFTNLFLHTLNTLFLFWVFNQMTDEMWPSALVAALFAVHPCHVETVAWISDRKDLLGGLFWLLCMGQYYRYTLQPTVRRMLPLLLLFVLGLMSKPNLVTLPIILLLLDIWPLKRIRTDISLLRMVFACRGLVMEKAPLFVLTAAFSLIAYLAQREGGGIGTLEAYTVGERLSNAIVAYGMYVYKTIWPTNLTVFYPFEKHLPPTAIASSLVLLVAMTIFAVRFRKKFPPLPVGWFWFVIALVPVIGIIKIGGFYMADRYTYIPHIGLFMIIAWGVKAIWHHIPVKWPVFLISCLSMVALITVSSRQVRHWQNSRTLFTHALQVNQDNYFAHYALGLVFAKKGKYQNAGFHLSEAVDLAPHKTYMRIDHGRALIIDSRFGDALETLGKVLEKDLTYRRGEANFLIGLSFFALGNMNAAVDHLAAALDLSAASGSMENKGSTDGNQPSSIETMASRDAHRLDRQSLVKKIKMYATRNDFDEALMLLGVKSERSFLIELAKKGYPNWLSTVSDR
jgi:Tfp pilus assembly protein PilF